MTIKGSASKTVTVKEESFNLGYCYGLYLYEVDTRYRSSDVLVTKGVLKAVK